MIRDNEWHCTGYSIVDLMFNKLFNKQIDCCLNTCKDTQILDLTNIPEFAPSPTLQICFKTL